MNCEYVAELWALACVGWRWALGLLSFDFCLYKYILRQSGLAQAVGGSEKVLLCGCAPTGPAAARKSAATPPRIQLLVDYINRVMLLVLIISHLTISHLT